MTKRMLIDATHAEETRVVVLDGSRLEDFDVETSTKRQLKGNIYLAKVVRVEPSLQAAFVEYGGNRHGFLAFGEVHPDYYQIPVADRQRLLAMQAEDARREEEEEDRAALHSHPAATSDAEADADPFDDNSGWPADPEAAETAGPDATDTIDAATGSPGPAAPDVASLWAQPARVDTESIGGAVDAPETLVDIEVLHVPAAAALPAVIEAAAEPEPVATTDKQLGPGAVEAAAETMDETATDAKDAEHAAETDAEPDDEVEDADTPETSPPETVGGDTDAAEDLRERRIPPRFLRNYKIQEVIHRRQILLVQVVKEERGTKGAALTTYISLAGRYCVLMPNSPRGGGISRKITSAADRRRLKEVTAELDIPDGMGLIVRTAGANRPKPEIKRDCEYLMRLWDDIREHTMKSVAPALIYEEASLIKRSIRDVYSRDIDEILVDGEEGWKAARDFMRMLMPTHVKKVQLWRDAQPLFARQQVEAQLDSMLLPTVQLRSGGYLVINQTEALVAIDVNSGRSTRERGIEETALRTNLEAVDEVARQLRLRDLAGLIVIDLIDMESRKNNAAVERRLKEALKTDRARIQVGHISHFGLMEMSRQRLRPSLAETSLVVCSHCGGTGHVRGTESAAIHVLRDIEEEGAKRRAAEIMVRVAASIAMYILNHKRVRLAEIEARYAMHVSFVGDDSLIPPQIRVERVRAAVEVPVAVTQDARSEPEPTEQSGTEFAEDLLDEEDDITEVEGAPEGIAESANGESGSGDEAERRRRRRRRRRGGRRDEGTPATTEPASGNAPPTALPAGSTLARPVGPQSDRGSEEASLSPMDLEQHIEGVPEHADVEPDAGAGDEAARGRRRGRRGGRRRRRDGLEGGLETVAEPGAEQPELAPLYTGPTPANPFGGQAFDIFDVLEQAEQTADRPIPESAERAREPTAELTPEPADDPPAQPAVEIPPVPLRNEAPKFAGVPVVVEAESVIAAEPELVTDATAPPVPANDATPETLVKPIVIGAGADAPTAEKKSGWWRR